MSVHDTNDPEQILKSPIHEILERLVRDANKLASLGAIDQKVLHSLTSPGKEPKSERDKRLEEALGCVDAVVKNAYQARHALEALRGR